MPQLWLWSNRKSFILFLKHGFIPEAAMTLKQDLFHVLSVQLWALWTIIRLAALTPPQYLGIEVFRNLFRLSSYLYTLPLPPSPFLQWGLKIEFAYIFFLSGSMSWEYWLLFFSWPLCFHHHNFLEICSHSFHDFTISSFPSPFSSASSSLAIPLTATVRH